MTDIMIVEVFGIKMESRCASLLRIVMDTQIRSDLREEALEKLGGAGCTKALEHIVRSSEIRSDFREKALGYM